MAVVESIMQVSEKVAQTLDKVTDAIVKKSESTKTTDRYLQFMKKDMPMLMDANPNLEEHNAEWQQWMNMMAAGNVPARDDEVLVVYGQSLEKGGIRSKVFENEMKRARMNNRLPGEAKELLYEIQTKLMTTKKRVPTL